MNEGSLLVVALAGILLCIVLLGVLVVRVLALARERDDVTRTAADLRARLDATAQQAAQHERDMRGDLAIARREQGEAALTLRREQGEAATTLRREVGERLAQFQSGTQQSLTDAQNLQREQLAQFGERLGALTQAIEQKLEALRHDNALKLEQMRATVDEKLQSTLDQRLGESFKLVSERLEKVHQGLGEMQNLAAGVGDLKRVMTNVKSRGGWGEVQLGALLAEMLTPAQYATNVATRPGKGERVEFAIRLPGRNDDGDPCWLPIDAKFPQEDYQRLQDAVERADVAAVEASRAALDTFFRNQAKMIRDKYIEPPFTTDFAILFVPTEGLYAEAMARAGLADRLQREHRVMLAGPMNLAAMLNSLQLGFRTLAIEKQSTEVWRVLGAVKTEFGKFGDLLAQTKERLDKVGRTLDDASRKSKTIERKLRSVEALPEEDAERLLTAAAAPSLALPAEDTDGEGPADG
ncbi:MAG: DNA recombination protein RmuC [Proteobacteria bacterium]|nr:DNA recombination protein RmuC [Pseudomonadota bacterium]